MSRSLFVFRKPARFVVGTIGQPGDRTFFVQVSEHPRTVSVRCEKEQALILAERMSSLLDEVAEKLSVDIPEAAREVDDLDPLALPVDAEFRVGMMGLGWDAGAGLIVVELLSAESESADESMILSDTETGPDALRVFITPDQARQFVLRSERVVAAGRATCPLCSETMDQSGHVCVRLNGYHGREGFDVQSLLAP